MATKLGIEKTREAIQDLGQIMEIIICSRGKKDWNKLRQELDEFIKDMPDALPELADLDMIESGMLSLSAYSTIQNVLKSCKLQETKALEV